jgi:hypothetical protein
MYLAGLEGGCDWNLCEVWDRIRTKAYSTLVEKSHGRGHCEDLDINREKILKWFLKK